MTLFQRAHDILAAKTNKALDAAEQPDEMLDLSYEQMLDQLTKVRQALVTVAASRKQIELQEQQLQHSADHLEEQAKAALGLGKEDLAREALQRKAAAQTQIDGMESQHQQLNEEQEKLEQTLAALQERVNQFRTQKETLKAQYTAANAEASVNESVAGISSTLGDSGAALQRAQDKIANMQARAGALVALFRVTGDPTLDARKTSWLSGMIPSSGVARISRISSMLSISPRVARAESYRVISTCFSTRSPLSALTVFESSIPMMRSESRTDETSGLVTMTASSA